MTDRAFRSLCKYILAAAVQFGLRDWDITIHLGGEGPEAIEGQEVIASVDAAYGRKSAHVYIHPPFLHASPDEQRHVITHELVHIHTRQLHDLLWTTVKPVIGSAAWDVLQPAIRLADEHAVDALASALAPSLPLWGGR